MTTYGQEGPPPTLNIGDPAPPLRIREWLKGAPIQQFRKGHVYVVEFWATWCKPCRAAMPHLSELIKPPRRDLPVRRRSLPVGN